MADNPPIPATASDDDRFTLGWCQEALQEGEGFLKAQQGYEEIQSGIDAIMGIGGNNPLVKLSRARSNRTAKIASDLAALLTDTKVFWEYKTENNKYDKHIELLGKRSTNWYYNRQIDMRFSDMVRYWAVAATSYAHLTYNSGIQDIDCAAEDPRDVIPIRPSGYESLQSAQGVVIRRERSVNYVRELYPDKAPLIVADRDGALQTTGAGPTQALFRSLGVDPTPFQQALWGDSPKRTLPKMPVVDLYTMYVRDERRNETSSPVMIGQFDNEGKPRNNWSYIVQSGQPLYPNKRMIQFTKTAVLYNSTSIYWHGMFPLCKFSLDPWPWSWLGKAPIWDLLPLQKMYDESLRALNDLLNKFVQPDLIADKNSISRASLNALNTRAAGQKFLSNMIGKGVQVQYPSALGFDLAFKIIEILRDEMDTISGVRDMSQLMRLNQLPGADTIEKLTESMSPSVRGRSRAMEAFIREFAKMLAFNFAQFDTTPMRVQMFGAAAVTAEDMESYTPGSWIPSYVSPGDYNSKGMLTAEATARGPLPEMDRAKIFMDQFTFHVAPGSLLASSEIERKLLYLQLASRGMVDKQTLLEVLAVPNIPQVLGRLKEEQAQMMMMQAGAQGLAEQQAGGGMEGRPPSWNAMPKQAVKDGGTRPTITTS